MKELDQFFMLTLAVPANGGKIWMNEDRTVLVRLWGSGRMHVATRDEPDAVWGPPVELKEDIYDRKDA